jgi:predicted ATPase
MITQMTVENFKALKKVTVDLNPLTVLIGPNDTGKSSFLEAVFALAESTRSPLAQCFWSPWQGRELVYRQGKAVNLSAQLKDSYSSDQKTVYELAIEFSEGSNAHLRSEHINGSENADIDKPGGITGVNRLQNNSLTQPNHSQKRDLQIVYNRLHSPILSRWNMEELARPSKLPTQRKFPIHPSGYGLSSCLTELKLQSFQKFSKLLDGFRFLFPGIVDVPVKRGKERIARFDPFDGFFNGIPQPSEKDDEVYSFSILREDGVEIPSGLASGGSLIALAFLTLAHLPEPRKLLLIEEPENGIHPGILKEMIDVFRKATTRPPECQVIMTTHSPLLLDFVEPEEVRIFLRNEENEIEVFNAKQIPDIHDRLKYLMLGELIYNEGEKEIVEEIRQHANSHPG